MQSFYRTIIEAVIFFAAALCITACGKHPPVAGPVAPMPPLMATTEDKHIVVARVNGSSITMYSLIGVINRIIPRNKPEAPAAESLEKIVDKALDRLITEELIYQEALRQGLRIELAEIDKAIANFRRNVGSEEQFQDYLAKGGLTEAELRSPVERLLLIDAVFNREVREKVFVTDEDIRREYERQKDQFIVPEMLTAIDIIFFLKLDDPASIQKANAVLAVLNADTDKDPGKLAPDRTFIVREMDLEQEKTREPELYNAARLLKPGELSPVIRTHDSIHILKLMEFSPQSWKTLEEVRGTVENGLKVALQKKRRDEWIRELKRSAKIEIIGECGSQCQTSDVL